MLVMHPPQYLLNPFQHLEADQAEEASPNFFIAALKNHRDVFDGDFITLEW